MSNYHSLHVKSKRSNRGAGILVIAAVFLVMTTMIGFFSAEVWHTYIVRQQLGNACDCAGLAAAAALASSSYPSLVANTRRVGAPNIPTVAELQQSRINAQSIALQVFQENAVAGHSLSSAFLVTNPATASLSAWQTAVSIGFFDKGPSGSLTSNPISGTHVVVSAATCARPMLDLSILGKEFVVQASGRSASARFDMAFCLDNSESMGVDTVVGIVRREWSQTPPPPAAGPQIVYSVVPRSAATRQLGAFAYPTSIKAPVTNFDAALRGKPNLASTLNTGVMPGNFSPYVAPVSPSSASLKWTDVVVLPSGLDDQNNSTVTVGSDALGKFSGGAYGGGVQYTFKGNTYIFNNIATMVEASRGNLEDPTNSFYTTYLKPLGLPAQSGYEQAYEAYAIANTEPFHSECVQVSNFFELLNANTDVHICLVPFSAGAGTVTPGTSPYFRVGSAYEPLVGLSKTDFPFEQVPLSLSASSSAQITKLFSALTAYHLFGGTDTDQGLQQAYDNLVTSGQHRIGARRVVMLLSDGAPTTPVSLSEAQAQNLGSQGIPLFPIAFVHTSSSATVASEIAFMQDLAGKCSAAGGTGSTELNLSSANMAQLQMIFRQIAHQLVTLE